MWAISFTTIFLILCDVIHISATCSKGVYGQGVSQIDRAIIVRKHNELRLLIARGKVDGQPKGVNLKRMRYSSILAQKAQQIANTCVYAHQQVTGTEWKSVGQNLYMSMTSSFAKGPDWKDAIQTWFDGHQHYHFGDPPDEKTGHYTQVVWAETEYVGCGFVQYPGTYGGDKYHKFYVCNYGPGGNVVNEKPYKTGNSGCINLC